MAISHNRRTRKAPARWAAAALAVLLSTFAGVGWLYLQRAIGALSFGPHVAHALPLQRLAGDETQPLARLVVAWVPAGMVAGLALESLLARGRLVASLFAGVVTLVILLLAGGLADAVTASESLAHHLSQQPGRAATWLAAGLMALGALIVPRRS